MNFAEGRLIAGKYRLLEELGRGGMGVVYKATDIKLKRTIAVKFLSPDLIGEPDHLTRFLREAQMASALNHPHICTIYEIGEEDGVPYIAMEHVPGRPLRRMTLTAPLPEVEVVKYGIQIAGALEYAHGRGIIHRDLKTANAMITPEGQVKILDFGLAKRLDSKDLGEDGNSQNSITEAGSFLGTMHYAAPEVLRGEVADSRSDLWSTGVMLYEMAAGRLPFEGRTGFELTSAILRDPPAPLPPEVPIGLQSIIWRGLEKEGSKRFQRADELRRALETLATAKLTVSVESPPAGYRGRRNAVVISTVLIAVFVMIWTLILKRGHPQKANGSQTSVSTGGRSSLVPEANEYFEKGMMFLKHQFDLPRARMLLERALSIDPKFAEARAWHGFTFVLEIDSGFSNDSGFLYKAEEELRRALQDDPNTARAYSSLAVLFFYQGRKELMVQEIERALAVDPRELDAKNWLANFHKVNGENAKAKDLLRQVLKQDPLFFPARMNFGEILSTEGDYAAAIQEQEKILEQDPQNIYAIQKKAKVYLDRNDLSHARLCLESLPPGGRRSYEIDLTWALLLALEGKKSEALKKMDDDVLKYAALAVLSTLAAAEFFAVLGESQEALDWLEQAVRNGDERDDWFRRDRLLASLRDLPRFKQILESIAYRRRQRPPSLK
jgi:serine/threonine protein kinase/Tfp pilus assembly protein PilF